MITASPRHAVTLASASAVLGKKYEIKDPYIDFMDSHDSIIYDDDGSDSYMITRNALQNSLPVSPCSRWPLTAR